MHMDTRKAHLLARLLVTIDEIEGIPPDDYTERSGMTKDEINDARRFAYDLCHEHGYGFKPTEREVRCYSIYKAVLENLDDHMTAPVSVVIEASGIPEKEFLRFMGNGMYHLEWQDRERTHVKTDERGAERMLEVVDFHENILTVLRG